MYIIYIVKMHTIKIYNRSSKFIKFHVLKKNTTTYMYKNNGFFKIFTFTFLLYMLMLMQPLQCPI